MARIVTFGELMLRLQPFNYERFVQASNVEFTFGGGEANVSVSLANYGMDAAFVTKLPAHAIGQAAVNSLRRYGVDTSLIVRGGERVGIYYNEKGASQRGSVCIYDRAYSAIQLAKPEDFDWDKIFEGADWFHFTGITPALGPNVVEICKQACQAAKAKGIKISCDLNYRGKLWTRAQAREAMTDLCQYVDVCIANEEDAKDVFGIEAENTDITGGKLSHDGYKDVAKQLSERFNLPTVAITLRSSLSASDNNWAAMLYVGGEAIFSKKYAVHIVDRVGGGDSFGAGLIYALLSDYSSSSAIEFAVAASALKHSIEVAQLSGLLAAELGLDVRLAKRAGLLHDIGKSVDHEMEGSHIQIGVDLCRKYKESATVINAVESHHGDAEPTTLIACLVQAADTISAARPGARRENLETYIKRLQKLEEIANNFEGVEKSFAIQAGREIRIMIKPEVINDEGMVLVARDIAKKIETELEYPGQIKVNVIREFRGVEYAK